MSSPASVLVIGGGISGLSCACALRSAGVAAQVLEAGPRPGGVIRTERHDGYLCDLGPQSFLLTEELLQLSRDQEKALGTEIAQIPVVPFGADHAARPRARLEDLRGDSGRAQRAGTRQTGNAAADHQD